MLTKLLRTFSNLVYDYTFPHRCANCAEFIDKSIGLCSGCFSKLSFITSPYCTICGNPFGFEMEGRYACGGCVSSPPKYDIARSLFSFDEYSKKLIHDFKYNDKTSNAKLFAKLIFSRYKQDFSDVDFIAPVPMHRLKRIIRHYNPPQILGQQLSQIFGVPQIADLLIKSKWTKAQTSLSGAARKDNLRGSLKVNTKYNIKKKTILLVDDVRTTGTTSNLCSNLLKNSGAKSVKLVTIGST